MSREGTLNFTQLNYNFAKGIISIVFCIYLISVIVYLNENINKIYYNFLFAKFIFAITANFLQFLISTTAV